MKISDSELRKLTEAMENKNLSVSQVIELIRSNNVRSEKTIDIAGEIKLTVDYTKTVEQAIKQAGLFFCYNREEFLITKNFPHPLEMKGKKVEISTKLFHFGYPMDYEDAIALMDKDDYRPANLMELLALALLYPTLQRRFKIIALGSGWLIPRSGSSSIFLPLLTTDTGHRAIDCIFLYNGFAADYRFLGVKK